MAARLILLALLFLVPSQAFAVPAAAAFIQGVAAGITGAAATAGATAAFAFGTQVGAFFATSISSLLLQTGLSFVANAIFGQKPDVPAQDELRYNTRLEDSQRWQVGGFNIVGGAAGSFGEYDADGNFWYIVIHCDNELLSTPIYYLDDIEVELDEDGNVTTDDFCLTAGYSQYDGVGTKVPYFRLYTVTIPQTGLKYGQLPTGFTDAFPDLPEDFRLTGTTFTVVRCKSIPQQHYGKAFRWRGPMGLGEPSVAMYADFSRMYDPRNAAHDINDSTTWTSGNSNAAIVWAWWRTHAFGRNKAMADVNWDRVAVAADICDEQVVNRSGEYIPRYRCGIAVPDSQTRSDADATIRLTFDAMVFNDDEGRVYPKAGKYEEPVYAVNGSRDIISAMTQIVDDGEAALDGVVVNYLSPDHNYTSQPCAPWKNPNFYDETREPNYLYLDILGCQDHNQAVRLAKAYGGRVQPTQKAAFVSTVYGVLLSDQRSIYLNYDSTFTGVYEIASPVEKAADGNSVSFGVVPLASDRWGLQAGEEGEPPSDTPVLVETSLATTTVTKVGTINIASERVTATSARVVVSFDEYTRADYRPEFRFYDYETDQGTEVYQYLSVADDAPVATSATVRTNRNILLQSRTVTASGRASAWELHEVFRVTSNITPPIELTSATFDASTAGQVTISLTSGNDPQLFSVVVRRNTTNDLSTANVVDTVYIAANQNANHVDIIDAGSYYYWVTPANASGIDGPQTSPTQVTVT